MIVEATTLHGPVDLGIVIATESDRLAEWDWTKRLPHVRLDESPALFSSDTELTAWAEFRSSPVVARGFCKDCGTPLYMQENGHTLYDVAIGTLDDPNAVSAFSGQVGVESKVAWFDTLHSLPQKSTDNDRTPEDLAKLVTRQHPDRDTDVWPPR